MPVAVAPSFAPSHPPASSGASATDGRGVGVGAGAGAGAGGRHVDERGRLVDRDVSEGDRRLAILMHLSPLIALGTPLAFAIPLVIWLCCRDRSAFLDDHGRAALDALISYSIWFLLAAVTVIGVVLIPVLIIVGLVVMIRAAADAGSSRYVRYPLALSILS